MKTMKTLKRYLNNSNYLCKGINAKVLNGNISEVALSVTIKDTNYVAGLTIT